MGVSRAKITNPYEVILPKGVGVNPRFVLNYLKIEIPKPYKKKNNNHLFCVHVFQQQCSHLQRKSSIIYNIFHILDAYFSFGLSWVSNTTYIYL